MWAGAGAALIAVALVGAAAAWACSPSASTLKMMPDSGAVNSEVTVSGQYFTPVVEIRWGSTTGPLLAKVAGPNFSATVRVPAVDPGYHYIVALGMNSDGSVAGKSSGAFEVTGATASPAPTPAPEPAPADPTPAPAPAASSSSPASSAPSASATAPAAASAPVAASAAAPSSPSASSPAAQAATPTATASQPGTASAPAGAAVRTQTSTGTVAAAVVPAGPAAAASPAPAAATPAPSEPAATPAPATASEPAVQPAWQSSIRPDQRVGLLSDVPASHGPGAGRLMAVALGVTTLFGGFLVVAASRRRQLARTTSR